MADSAAYRRPHRSPLGLLDRSDFITPPRTTSTRWVETVSTRILWSPAIAFSWAQCGPDPGKLENVKHASAK
jgi:hypothetical protein